ncbi:hypothetical protein CYMTET_36934 [Cymbomonas tetramitiformis]|uniref:Uncharacterized protein n=1 Tax=Cymbomonas tetramitiformis TaxID=36881 RepID=A0AAE0CEZ9_9CHLO|nr:hypothetical protein CYMTET_36934 [Cymbomonas tetramitiformis]
MNDDHASQGSTAMLAAESAPLLVRMANQIEVNRKMCLKQAERHDECVALMRYFHEFLKRSRSSLTVNESGNAEESSDEEGESSAPSPETPHS